MDDQLRGLPPRTPVEETAAPPSRVSKTKSHGKPSSPLPHVPVNMMSSPSDSKDASFVPTPPSSASRLLSSPPPSHHQPQQLSNNHARKSNHGSDARHPAPPNSSAKNTRHVPCKFFRQGACQAGPACPFSHSVDASVDTTPCKYFAKGNCKFGAKCALAHILPDGRRVNRAHGLGIAGAGLVLGGRVNPPPPFQGQDSALASSLLMQQRMNNSQFTYPPGYDEASTLPPHLSPPMHTASPPPPQQPTAYHDIPIMDHVFAEQHPKQPIVRPDDSRAFLSPVIGRTALDAPLPASFDSEGVSFLARHGPVAASLPSKFGLDYLASPPARPREQEPEKVDLSSVASPDRLRTFQEPAFPRPASTAFSSTIPERELTSPFARFASLRTPETPFLSTSMPRPTVTPLADEFDDSLHFRMEEEDHLPASLHDDILTPEEQLRHQSRAELDSMSHTYSLSSTSKVGSPLSSSPSRFGPLFAKQRQKREEEALASSFGHGHGSYKNINLSDFAGNSKSGADSNSVGSAFSPEGFSPLAHSPFPLKYVSMESMLSSKKLNGSPIPFSSRPAVSPIGAGVGASSSTPVSLPRHDQSTAYPLSTRLDEEPNDMVFTMEEEETGKQQSKAGEAGNNTSTGSPWSKVPKPHNLSISTKPDASA